MSSYINYWLVEGITAKDYKGNSPYIYSFIGDGFTIDEIKNKARELFTNNKCDGVLYRVIRENAYGETTRHYFTYYDSKGFHSQKYIDKIGLMFEPFIMDGKQYAPALPVGY
jgi:hypothetical protein